MAKPYTYGCTSFDPTVAGQTQKVLCISDATNTPKIGSDSVARLFETS
jgi:hypothetical protein